MADLSILQSDGARKGKVVFNCAHCEHPATRFRSQATARNLFCSKTCVSEFGISSVRCCWPGCEIHVRCRAFDRKRKGGKIVREYKTELNRGGLYTKFVLCSEHRNSARRFSGSDGRFTNGRHKLLANIDAEYDVRSASSRFLRFVVFERANGQCERCRCQMQFNAPRGTWQIDHAVPICDGGKTSLRNLQILCTSCHDKKTAIEKSRVAKDRHLRVKTHRWHTHKQKDDLIARLRARLEALGEPTD